ncbi:MAG: acetoacetate--CoA ligase [Phaeobacter gallaeciensis]
MTVQEGEILWTPTAEFAEASNVRAFMRWLREEGVADCDDYQALWEWSTDEIEAFWAAVWRYSNILSDAPYNEVVSSLEFKPGVQWFAGSKVNLAEHILRHEVAGKTALHYLSEQRPLQEITWEDLASRVRILATAMRDRGLQPGDAVCCLLPNLPETVIAMLATISIGCVWSVAAPEFGTKTIVDRFSQIKPKWMFVSDGYSFGGKAFDRSDDVRSIVEALSDSLKTVVFLPLLDPDRTDSPVEALRWHDLLAGSDPGPDKFEFERVASDHPLWVVFSSGTTGLPKAIVHSHVGVLLGSMVVMPFHMNLKSDDVAFFYTTTGWIMFNLQVMMMLTGCAAVLYDGNPAYPTADVLWKMAADTGTTFFGASPTYVQLMERQGLIPGKDYDLSRLRGVLLGGSPSTPETFDWFYRNVKQDLWVTSQSGGTEIAGGFVGAVPTQPVYAGEIQARVLGMDVDALDENGRSVIGEVGELVCKKPFPTMPLQFLNDEGDRRYFESYFAEYPGIWRHGDFIKINERGGAYIYGRSDSTLNRYGVRIGTAELYRTAENVPAVADSLAVCIELPNGKFFMPIFLQLDEGCGLDQELIDRISEELRKHCSPRHVPDKFYQVPEIPYTLTGKKLEVPVRKLLLGWPEDKALSRDSMKNPGAIDWFVRYVSETTDYSVPA